MFILIDGYNLLKQIIGGAFIDEHERMRFVNLVSQYRKIKKHKIMVVFDGGPFSYPSRTVSAGVALVYAGQDQSADEYIKKILTQKRNNELLLVSSDNELAICASDWHIPSIESIYFWQLIQNFLFGEKKKRESKGKYDGELIKISPDDNKVLDKLMMEESQNVPMKEDDRAIFLDQFSLAKSSKKERVALSIIRKLL